MNINGNSFDVAANAKIGTIEFNNLTFIGKKSAGGGDHIFNVSKGIKCTIEHVKFVNCNASDYDRSFLRTQADTEVIENVTIENCVISVVSGTTQAYDVVQLGIAPVTTTIKNSTFTNIAAFVRFNAADSAVGNVTVENCTFSTRSGGQYFRMANATTAEVSVKNCVFAGALLKVGNNADSANSVKTMSGNFAASDMTWTSFGNIAATDWATAESLTSAELFPNAASGNYAPAASSQAKAAGAGDPRWLE